MEKLIALLNFVLLSVTMVWFIPLLALAHDNSLLEAPPSARAFIYMYYLGEQAKPFPLLVLTPNSSEVPAELQQLLDRSVATARRYTVTKQQFLDTWQFLACEYPWQNYHLPLRGQDFYEVVLWDRLPKQTFMSRKETLKLLQHILALIQNSNPNLSEEIHALVRRLSN